LSHRISFRKTWETLEPLWLTLLLCSDLLTKKQIQAVIARFYWYAGQQIMAPQRSRSCPRVLRQRTQPWPRKTNQPSYTGPLEVTIVATSS
jgi:hypothetical protein